MFYRTLVYQETGQTEAWFIASTFATAVQTVQHYRQLMWIEKLSADFRQYGFDLWHPRPAKPARLDRLTLIVCLLDIWLAAMGNTS